MSSSYVEAIVVRCSRPSSARAGDRARVLPDGTIEGFVGGSCADATVRLHALRCLETGEPLLVRIVPGSSSAPASEDGTVTVANPCLSGGALEIFLSPCVPAPVVCVVGDSPVARALRSMLPLAGFSAGEDADFGVVVASHDHGDADALRAAVDSGVPYVALLASRRRGAAVLEEAGVDPARVSTPAGLDIGARTPGEIAVSIVAEMIRERRRPKDPGLPSHTDGQLGSFAASHHCCGE
ncbi:MAG TPA: XdhC family protein [Actinomycetota bacterium]|nr:XdhC family protein [Actinomycetota bacterium]